MASCLSQAGFKPQMLDWAAPDDLSEQIRHAKEWWKKNGHDFLSGADVPNPDLQSVFSISN
jgi:hypothetical protein